MQFKTVAGRYKRDLNAYLSTKGSVNMNIIQQVGSEEEDNLSDKWTYNQKNGENRISQGKYFCSVFMMKGLFTEIGNCQETSTLHTHNVLVFSCALPNLFEIIFDIMMCCSGILQTLMD